MCALALARARHTLTIIFLIIAHQVVYCRVGAELHNLLELSCWGGLSMKVSFLYVYSLGQFVTKCQKVSFSSPHNLHLGFIVGFALNCM